ncbi:MAG: efflux RND transporter periplasmic adaptor subunit, partial [Bacteroidota bacterium]
MKSYYFSVLLFVGTFLLYSCGSPEAEEQETTAERPAVSTDSVTTEATSLLKLKDLELYKVTKGDQQRSTPISGRVIPKNTTQLFAEVQGLILPEGILFKEGVAFKKGDLLVSLDKREYELSLEAQRSSFFNSLTAIMPDMKTDYPDNYDNWLTYINDYNFGSTLPPLPATLSKKEKYYVTTYQIYSQYYAIKAAEERLKKYSIYAPYSGIVIQSNID